MLSEVKLLIQISQARWKDHSFTAGEGKAGSLPGSLREQGQPSEEPASGHWEAGASLCHLLST